VTRRWLQGCSFRHAVGRQVLAVNVVCAALLLLTSIACNRRTQLQIYALAIDSAAEKLGEQKSATVEALSEAQQARNEALHRVNFTFASPETERFIDRWKQAEQEVRELRDDFNQLLEKSDFFFAYAEKKMRTIGDTALKSRADILISRKKESFIASANEANAAILELEVTVEKGKDLISALEIAGVLGSVSADAGNLDMLQSRAVHKMSEVQSLVNQGKGLVEVEFSALEKQ
jgi:PAS domain-containing protein